MGEASNRKWNGKLTNSFDSVLALQWLSPPGCAMFSLQLHIPMSSMLGQRLPIVQHLVAIAVVSAILSLPGYEVSVSQTLLCSAGNT